MRMTCALGVFVVVLCQGLVSFAAAPSAPPPPPTPEFNAGAKAQVAQINRVPYIATYYIQPKVKVGEKAVIRYYLTDYDNKDFMQDDRSARFTMDYWVNGQKTTLKDVAPGDNSITLPPLPKGKVLFALQATDAKGRKSSRLYQEFLSVDPAEEQVPADKVLTQPDLAKFNIHNDDTHPVETTQGLTDLLKWASDNGYRKVVLPKGKYRLDEHKAVQMATKVTLDMNGATFKLNPNALAGALMVEFVDCFDSHLINGTLEGDLHEHDFKTAPNNSEWVNAVSLSQGSEYCSVKDVTIIDITGYGSTTTHRHSYDRSAGAKDFALGDIDAAGQPVASEDRTTSGGYVDITPYLKSYGFLQFGVYLGYQGNPAEHWVYKASFYDGDKKFIESIEETLYRRLYPPKNAHYAKFTLYSTATPKNLAVYNFRAPYNCAFINVHHKNVRCVGMALAGFNNLLVEGCTFENCGWSSAKCAFDAEDGWDMMQDLTFRNNTFLKNPHVEFLLAGGHNFVMENNTMATYVWERNNGYVFRNNTLKHANFRFGTHRRTGYPRVYGNTIQGGVTLVLATDKPDREYCIKDNICQGGANAQSAAKNLDTAAVFYKKCDISGGNINAKVVDSTIKGMKNAGGTFEIYNSKISDSLVKTSGYHALARVVGCTITNSHLMTQGGTLLLDKNTLKDSECTSGGDWSDGHEYILTNNTVDTSLDHLVYVGNSYKQMVLQNNTIRSSNPKFSAVLLNNPTNKKLTQQTVTITGNTFKASGGYALNVPRLPNPECTLTVNLFNNTYQGLKPYSENLAKAPNVHLVLKKP